MRLVAALISSALVAGCGPAGPDTPSASAAAPSGAAETSSGGAPPAAPPAGDAAAPVDSVPAVRVVEQQVAYGEADEANLVGYLAMPSDAAEPLPGLVVVHDRAGLDDGVKAMTRRLAAEGYVALAVDLFGGQVPADAEAADALTEGAAARPEQLHANLRQAYEYLSQYAFAPKVGMIGGGFGAGSALQAALALDELDAVVLHYGAVVTDRSRLATLNAPLLGIFAANDGRVPAADVTRFRSALEALGKVADVRVVAGAGHPFSSPSQSDAAAREAWAATIAFLASYLKE